MVELSAQKPVHVVYVLPSGQRLWLGAVSTERDRSNSTRLAPKFFDQPNESLLVTYEYGLIIQRRLSDEGDHRGIRRKVLLVLEPLGPAIDEPERQASDSRFEDSRQKHFVALSEGRGFIVVPGYHPDLGPCWWVRANDQPTTLDRQAGLESIRGRSPQVAAERARDTWGEELMFQDPEKHARETAERAAAVQAEQIRGENSYQASLRPGDRRR